MKGAEDVVRDLLDRHGLDEDDVLDEEEAWALIREAYGQGYVDAHRLTGDVA